MKRKVVSLVMMAVMLISFLTGCSGTKTSNEDEKSTGVASSTGEKITLTVGAAASLKNSMEELKTIYEKENSNVTLEFTYGSSGTLMTQIVNGAKVDVFFSAAMKQMDSLGEKNYVDKDKVKTVLKNKLVLIIPKDGENNITKFEDIVNGKIIAMGDPDSVPAGQYAKETLTNLKLYDKVSKKLTLGTDVTQVLNWVESAEADAGLVYHTDTISSEKVIEIAQAPDGSCPDIIYPISVIKGSKHSAEAEKLVEWLSGDDAMKIFVSHGFEDGRE